MTTDRQRVTDVPPESCLTAAATCRRVERLFDYEDSAIEHGWRPERAVPITDVIETFLDGLERAYSVGARVTPADEFLPLSTGVVALDRVCGGGLRRGTVTLVEGPIEAQGRALLFTVARSTTMATLLAVDRLAESTPWLLAGVSGVPATLIQSGNLEETDWRYMVAAVDKLRRVPLEVAEVWSVSGLTHVVANSQTAVVLVDNPERYGLLVDVVHELLALARTYDAALLVSAATTGGLADWHVPGVTRVVLVPQALGSRALLLAVGGEEGLAAAPIHVALLSASVS